MFLLLGSAGSIAHLRPLIIAAPAVGIPCTIAAMILRIRAAEWDAGLRWMVIVALLLLAPMALTCFDIPIGLRPGGRAG